MQNNYGIDGPEGAGFIYPSIVILDGNDKIQELAVVENVALVSEKRAEVWKFLSTCFDNSGSNAKFSVYVPVGQKEKAQALLIKNDVKNYNLHGYRIMRGYLEIDGSLVYNVDDASIDDLKNLGEIPENQNVKTETQRFRVIRINATTGYPYFDQADNSWSTTFLPAVVNDEVKRFGLKGPGDMGMIYPSVLILDTNDNVKLIGMMEPAENVTEERAKVWQFISNSLDNHPLKYLYIHVPHGLEAKALDILERNKINYSGLRGYSVVDGKLLITLATTYSTGDNR